jgi:alanine dehydrogenase
MWKSEDFLLARRSLETLLNTLHQLRYGILNGCFETSHPTTHADPVYTVDGILHYCVANIPGAVPFTSTLALTNATLPYAVILANMGWEQACAKHDDLRKGLNIVNGKVVCKAVADTFGL